jgi:hypothetical protein
MAKNHYEVMIMEESNVLREGASETSSGFAEAEEKSRDERTRGDCFRQCMDDPWDMKGESVCASACGL